jgi:hypothetical protein
LRLDDAERAHLHELAAGTRRRPGGRRPAPERVTAAVRQLVTALGDVPAVVLGRRPNMVRLMFLDAHPPHAVHRLAGQGPRRGGDAADGVRAASGRDRAGEGASVSR